LQLEKLKIRGLLLISGRIFFVWGLFVGLKGVWDAFIGEPEANYFSPHKWDFVSRAQWFTWSGFEIAYSAASIITAILLFYYAKRMPEFIERPIQNKTLL
jgi:hypothetical protein